MEKDAAGAFGGITPMLELIELIYASAQRPELWGDVVRTIVAHVGSERSALFLGSPNAFTPELITIENLDPKAWLDFVTYYVDINPVMILAEQNLSPDRVWFSRDVITDADLERSEFYIDFLEPNEMHHIAALRLQEPGMAPANLSLQRSKRSGDFDERAQVVLHTLRPHLLRALSLRGRLGALEERALGFAAAIDAYRHAVVAIDEQGRVVFASRSGEALLREHGALAVAGGRLQADDPARDHELQQLVLSAVQPALETAPSVRNTVLLYDSEGHMLRVTILPHRRAVPGIGGSVAALVFLMDSSAPEPSRSGILTGAYGLTPNEARIADLLASGRDVAQIAEMLRLTQETVRFYIKRSLAKTGSRRQADLVRLVLGGVPG